MILRARVVVTMEGAPIENGAVVVSGDRIVEVGRWPEVRARWGGEEVHDLGEVALLPGLINAHCHLDYTGMRGRLPRGLPFPQWIRAINALKASWSEEDYLRSITEGCTEAARFGTTTIANLEAFPELISQLPTLPMRLWWFAELIDLRGGIDVEKVLSLLPAPCGLAPHAPYTASAELYRATAAAGVLATTHLAESREEMAMFREGRGEMFEFLRELGRPMGDCARALTPLAHLLELGVLDERWIVAHVNELTDDDLRLLEAAPRFHVAHCPRSHAFFGHTRFRFGDLRARGFNICLATDSLASNDDLSLFAEMREFRQQQPAISAREILAMVTTHPARALQSGAVLGRIAPGSYADLIVVPTEATAADDVFESAVEFRGEVPWRMLRGEVALPR